MMTADALAASPSGMLDAHSSRLRLVTDAVNEDDALCVARACRALRDALGAHFPVCPRAGGRAVARLAAKVIATEELDLSYGRCRSDSDESDGDDGDDGGLRALPKGFG
jgi:hypothetical protein